MMNFNDYQKHAHSFATYDGVDYPKYGLFEEAGELAKIFAKLSRGDKKYTDMSFEELSKMIISESGDVLWMLSEILSQYGLSLQDVAEYNITKLTDRKNRNVIKGDGNFR